MTNSVSVEIEGVEEVTASLEEFADDWEGSPTWVVGSPVHYAGYVEFGTSRMAAQPYLRPATEAALRDADLLFEQSDTIEEFMSRLALSIERRAKERAPVDTGRLRASIEANEV